MDQLTLRTPCPEGEYSPQFLQGMIDRMAVSFHKYGAVSDSENLDPIGNIAKRLEKYAETGNTEWLMDVANFAMIEFMVPHHPEAHFRPTDSNESPGRVATDGHVTKARNESVMVDS